MTSRPDDYSPPPSAGPSGYRGPEALVGFPPNSHFSSFFIDDILGDEGRLGKKFLATPPARPSRPLPVYPSSTPSPLPSPPSSPVDQSGGWPAPGLPSAVTPDALALDGGGVLADYRLLPPPFALFHQNVMTSGPHCPHRDCRLVHHHQHHQHQHHQQQQQRHHPGPQGSQHCLRRPHGGTFPHFPSTSGTKSYLDYLTDPTAKGSCERWTPLQCHMMAMRHGRGLTPGTPMGGVMMGLCSSKRKGGQVRFSPDQTTALERRFGGHKYLSPEERRILAQDLKLTDRQVKTWFQNRRAKWRRSSQTALPSSSAVSVGGRRATSLPETVGGVVGGGGPISSSRNSTVSSGKGHESRGGDSDVEDEVFHEEQVGAAG